MEDGMRRLRRTIIALSVSLILMVAAVIIPCAVSKNGFWYSFYILFPFTALAAVLETDIISKALSACICEKKLRAVYLVSLEFDAFFLGIALFALAANLITFRIMNVYIIGSLIIAGFVFAPVSYAETFILFFVTRASLKKKAPSPLTKKTRYAVRIVIILQVVIIVLYFALFLYYYDKPLFVKYSESWIKGKTADEIMEEYGEFDSAFKNKGSDEYASVYYYVKMSRWGSKWWYEIDFDENGKAYSCELYSTNEDP